MRVPLEARAARNYKQRPRQAGGGLDSTICTLTSLLGSFSGACLSHSLLSARVDSNFRPARLAGATWSAKKRFPDNDCPSLYRRYPSTTSPPSLPPSTPPSLLLLPPPPAFHLRKALPCPLPPDPQPLLVDLSQHEGVVTKWLTCSLWPTYGSLSLVLLFCSSRHTLLPVSIVVAIFALVLAKSRSSCGNGFLGLVSA